MVLVSEARQSGAQVRGTALRAFVSRYAVLVAFAATIVFFCIARPESFATWSNVTSILGLAAPAAIIAIGLTFVLVTGDFDLSFASIVGLGAGATIELLMHGWGVLPAIALALAIGVAVGLANGFLIVVVGTDSFITTLAMGVSVTGIEYAFTNQDTIYGKLPPGFTDFTAGSWVGDINNLVIIALLLAVVAAVVLDRTEVGRYAYAAGDNAEAARLSGVRTTRLKIGAFVIMGALAAVTGALLVGQANSYSPNVGASYLLPAYAAAFLGTATLRPGAFTVFGTVVGVLFLGVIQTGLTMMSLDTWAINFVQGAILLAAIVLSKASRARG